MFKKETGTQFGAVPYRGAAPAVQDLVAGQIDLLFAPADWLPLMRAGSIKAYAVTSDTRLARAPDIPTFAEMGLPAISSSGWYGLFAPKGRDGRFDVSVAMNGRNDPKSMSSPIGGGHLQP